VNKRLRLYMYVVGTAFWTAIAVQLAVDPDGVGSLTKAAPLLALAVAGEELVVRQREANGSGAISFSAVAHVAAALVLTPVAAGLTAALGIVIGDGLRRDGRRFLLINSAMFGGAIWLAAGLFHSLTPERAAWTVSSIPALALLVLVRYTITTSIFSGGIAIAGGGGFFPLLRQAGIEEFASAAGEGSLGILVAFGLGPEKAILPFLLPLFGALYSSRANFERLRSETGRALNAIADVIDARDPSTAAHSERVAQLVQEFVDELGLPQREADRLVQAARFHDLGKIAVEVAVLTKDGRLTEEELAQIRRHPRLSAQLLQPFSFAREIAVFAELHHERWDGRGYYGVDGQRVPIEAHVLVAADSFDAMTSTRAYRPGLTKDEAVDELLDKAGSQFHPLVARAFAAILTGRRMGELLSPDEVEALRAEFSTSKPVGRAQRQRVFHPRNLALGSICLFLLLWGIPVAGVAARALGGLLVLTACGSWAVAALNVRGRRERAAAAIAAGEAPEVALAAAGFSGWAAWLPVEGDDGRSPQVPEWDRAEAASWARRHDDRFAIGLSSGTTAVFAPATRDGFRLVLGLRRHLRQYEQELARWLVEELSKLDFQPLRRLGIDFTSLDGARRGVVYVDLAVFDRVRIGAGQLVAERVVAEAERALRSVLRQNDAVVRLGDDRFGVSTVVRETSDLDVIRRRLLDVLADVPLPRRLERLSPRILVSTADRAAESAELARVELALLPSAERLGAEG
jgi:HD-GYP domain-containing protein (c-di-GMP phosphodiesterase class II)/GGDEF domain-containing protein